VLLAVVVAAGVWGLGLVAAQRATRAAIASAPQSWRERFSTEYGELLSARLHQGILSRAVASAAVLWLGLFALLDWGDVKLSIQVGLAAVYSVWAAASERRRQREEVAGWVASGLEPLQRNPSLAWSYTGSLFVVFLGFTTTMCFVARAVFDLAGG
jgi:hypothetical protein